MKQKEVTKDDLRKLAREIARQTSMAINRATDNLTCVEMPYRAQYVLEEVIESLKTMV